MALADSVPGVSGGTIAFILGFYDDFVNSRNVYWVADKAYNSPSESSRAKDYLLNNVLLKCNPDYQAN